jgi:hypothetical protein
MLKIITNLYKTKKIQAQLKADFYTSILSVVQEQENIKKLIDNIYNALKNTPTDELQQKLIEQIALIIHKTNNKNNDEMSD